MYRSGCHWLEWRHSRWLTCIHVSIMNTHHCGRCCCLLLILSFILVLLPSLLVMVKYTLLLLAVLAISSHAFTVSSSVSGFAGKVLVSGVSNSHSLEMKKGKANVPPQMRSQYARQRELMQQRDQMIAASKPGADGLPVFNLFVRTSRANVSLWNERIWLNWVMWWLCTLYTH